MKKVFVYSALLIVGLVGSQFLSVFGDAQPLVTEVVQVLTMIALSFIMIRVGYEFDIDRSRLRGYAVDYGVAATAAAFPWIFCSAYFVFVMQPEALWGNLDVWKEALLAGRFAAPTSAGLLFAMLIAAGLSMTWYFRKIRILAIFDDLDTVLFMIPLKMMIVGVRWQLGLIIVIMGVMLWLGWRYMHKWKLPLTWKWLMGYAIAITAVSETIYLMSKGFSDVVTVHIEVLLPAFVLGVMLKRPPAPEGQPEEHVHHGAGGEAGEKAAGVIAGAFMVLVGLSLPPIDLDASELTVGALAAHVALVTVLANLGKMFPLFMYRDEAHWKERLALCVGMWPRGEVGAGVLIVSLGYGIGGPMVTVAGLSLALNLLLTGVFIVIVKRLLRTPPPASLRSAGASPTRGGGPPGRRRELVDQEVDEVSDLGRQVPVVRV